MEILFIILVFLATIIMSYSLPVQIEEYAIELGLDYESVNSLYKTMSLKEEKWFIYRGKKYFLLKIFYKNYKVDPHRTVLGSIYLFNYYFYITGILGIIIILLNLFGVLSASFAFFFMIFLLVLVLLIYTVYSFYYEIMAGMINSNEIKKIKNEITYEYYLKNEVLNLDLIHKNYSNDPMDAIKEMVIDFNFATSLDYQLDVLDKMNYLIKYYDPIVFQNQLFNKFQKLFDYNQDAINYMNNMKKFYDLLAKNIFIKKKDLKELSYFISLLGFSVGFEKKIYEFEKQMVDKISEGQEISNVHKDYKILEDLVRKQIVIYKINEEMGLKKAKYHTEDEYFLNLVGNLLHDNQASKKKINKYSWISALVFSVILLIFIIIGFINLFSVGALIVLEFLFIICLNLYEKTRNIPYFNLYVALEKERILKYTFLGKYVINKK